MSRLNPNAEPFVPTRAQERATEAQESAHAMAVEEGRSLFMTFSIGAPLTWQEIFEHFTSVYGPCVEYVYVHSRENRSSPQFGRIIFKTKEMPGTILGDEEVVKVLVKGKPVWLKRYIPQNRRNN